MKEENNNIELLKKAYSEILEVCEKYQYFEEKFGSEFDDINEMIREAKNHLLIIEWYEKYGFELNHSLGLYARNCVRINSYVSFQLFEDAERCKIECYGRSIAWPDDGRQPEDGWYLCLSFPTGPYIFGEDYENQKQLFQDFFQELKSYKPDHSDTVNRDLYWKIENAKSIYNNFDKILKKYQEKNEAELKERRAKKLREELKKIEEE